MPSENGWEPAKASPDQCDWAAVPGTDVTLQLLRGWPLTIMRAVAADFNAYIEPLRDPDSAGWTPTNAVATSNHLNGTAMDLNWDSHPFRNRGSFNQSQMQTIRELLDFYEGCIFWAGDWDDPVDEMHWQMGYQTYGNRHVEDFINRKIRPDGFSTFRRGTAPKPQGMTVPLVQNANGTWTSPSRAWAHLIMRESGGDPYIIQQIIDVNSGGNEAEGLFQITPRTWRGAGGEQFAPSPRLASPQQQAIVAARIFTRNPSGSDWGAGLPGRENAAELAAGLVPITETPIEEDWLSALSPDEQRELLDRTRQLWGASFNELPSKSRYADQRGWATKDFIRNVDGHVFDLIVEHNAALGDEWSLSQVRVAAAKGDQIAANFLKRLTTGPTTTPPQPTTATPQPTQPVQSPPQPNTAELDMLRAENARLRDENTRLQAATSKALVPADQNGADVTTGQVIGHLYDAIAELNLAEAAPISDRATLSAAIKVLQTKNGADL